MRKLALLLLLAAPALHANQRAYGWCQLGGQQVTTVGIPSTTFFQQTFKSCTVTVYLTGTLNTASIFSDNLGTGKTNPFTADATGFWFFYAANGRYDVSMSGGATTISDILLTDVGTGGAITSLNGLTGTSQTFATGTAGSDFGISSSGTVHTFNIPSASASNRGLLLSADWTTFNSKQAALAFTAPLSLASNTVSLTLPITISQGGTGQTTAIAGFNALSPLTAKGDLLASNGSTNSRFGVGADTTILIADSTQGVGFRWGACAFCSLTSPLPVANGGTALTAGTSGGLLFFSGAGTIASSAALTSGALLLGAGAGNAPTTSGAATLYNGQTLSGQGVPPILYTITLQTAQAATVGPITAVANAPAGTYEACYYSVITQAATTSSSLTPSFNWNDGAARSTATTVTSNAPQFAAYAGNVAGTVLTGCATIFSAAAQNITYTFTYASVGGTVMQFSYSVTVKRIL